MRRVCLMVAAVVALGSLGACSGSFGAEKSAAVIGGMKSERPALSTLDASGKMVLGSKPKSAAKEYPDKKASEEKLVVPEPGGMVVLTTGIAGLAGVRRRK